MNIINIGILAHVDAGKTTLTESLLYASGTISEPGSVEKGQRERTLCFWSGSVELPFKRQSLLSSGTVVKSILWILPATWIFGRGIPLSGCFGRGHLGALR